MLTYSKVSADGKSRRAAYLIGDLKRMYTKLSVFNMDQYGMETKEMLPQTGIGSLIEGLQNPKKMEEGSWQELYRWYCAQEDWNEKVHDLARINSIPQAGGQSDFADRTEALWRLGTKHFKTGEICCLCLCAFSDLWTSP